MRQRRDDRGSVAIFVAVSLTLLVTLAAFAVDLGMQRVVRRDMQAIADVVALDLARELDGRTVAELAPEMDPGNASSALVASLGRNDDHLGEDLQVSVALGTLVSGVFSPVTLSTGEPTAVRVVATAKVGFAFAPGDGAASRTAVASTVKAGCFAVGSYAARFRSGDSALVQTLLGPMNGILEPQANIDALTYEGLASATVSINELVLAGAAGTVDTLLTTKLSGQKLIDAVVVALDRQSPRNTLALNALGQVLKGQADLVTPVLLTDVVRVSPSDAAALDVGLNVLDLVAGTLLVASGGHAVDLGNLSAGTGNLAPVGDARVTIIESPRQACGQFGTPQASASTSQLRASVPMKLQLPSINGITGATGVVQTPEAGVTITVNLGNATATLASDPTCASGTQEDPDIMPVDVQSGVAVLEAKVALKFEAKLSVSVPVLNVLGVQVGTDVKVVKVTFDQLATAKLDMPDQLSRAELRVPPHDTTPLSVGSPAPLGAFEVAKVATGVEATIGGVKVTDGSVLASVVSGLAGVSSQLAVNASVVGPLNSLVSSLNAKLVPLQRLLGLNVSGADLLALGRPVCASPVLRG